MTPRVVDKRAKRRQIQKAALKVFARTGLSGFKMIQVAEAAGVGKGTLYEYFPSKDDLIIGCFEEFLTEFDEHGRAAIAGITDPVEQIKTMISASYEFCLADRALLDTLFDFYAAGIPRRDSKSLLPQIAPMYRKMIDNLASVIENGAASGRFRKVDGREAAAMILAMVDGATFQLALQVYDADAREMARQTTDLILHGLIDQSSDRSDNQSE